MYIHTFYIITDYDRPQDKNNYLLDALSKENFHQRFRPSNLNRSREIHVSSIQFLSKMARCPICLTRKLYKRNDDKTDKKNHYDSTYREASPLIILTASIKIHKIKRIPYCCRNISFSNPGLSSVGILRVFQLYCPDHFTMKICTQDVYTRFLKQWYPMKHTFQAKLVLSRKPTF